MRFLGRMADNPWPQDMVIRVEDTPQHLTILLFIRHAWGIAADADVPGSTRCRTSAPHACRTPREKASGRPAGTAPGAGVGAGTRWSSRNRRGCRRPSRSARRHGRGRAWNPVIPPFWQADYGWAGIDPAAYNDWETLQPPRLRATSQECGGFTWRRSLQALTAAWRAGWILSLCFPTRGSSPADHQPPPGRVRCRPHDPEQLQQGAWNSTVVPGGPCPGPAAAEAVARQGLPRPPACLPPSRISAALSTACPLVIGQALG